LLEFEPSLEAVDFGMVPVGSSETEHIYALPAGRVSVQLSQEGREPDELAGVGVFQHAWGDRRTLPGQEASFRLTSTTGMPWSPITAKSAAPSTACRFVDRPVTPS
jgi:hypothetical protein